MCNRQSRLPLNVDTFSTGQFGYTVLKELQKLIYRSQIGSLSLFSSVHIFYTVEQILKLQMKIMVMPSLQCSVNMYYVY